MNIKLSTVRSLFKNKSQYRNGIVMTLPYGSNSSITISKYAVEGLKKIYKKGIE